MLSMGVAGICTSLWLLTQPPANADLGGGGDGLGNWIPATYLEAWMEFLTS